MNFQSSDVNILTGKRQVMRNGRRDMLFVELYILFLQLFDQGSPV
jgi:hypothetical protein